MEPTPSGVIKHSYPRPHVILIIPAVNISKTPFSAGISHLAMLGTGLWLRPCDHQLRASAAIGWARALGGLGGWEKERRRRSK